MNMFIRRIHLWLSVPLGLIVCIICLSGATMVFDSEITESLNPSIYKVERPEGAVPLQPSQIVEKVHRQLSDTVEVSSMEFSADPERACMLSIKGAEKKSLSVNQYTGEVNGWTESPQFCLHRRAPKTWKREEKSLELPARLRESLRQQVGAFQGLHISYGSTSGRLVFFLPAAAEELYHYFHWGQRHPSNFCELMAGMAGHREDDVIYVESLIPARLERRGEQEAAFSAKTHAHMEEELRIMNRHKNQSEEMYRIFSGEFQLVGYIHSHPGTLRTELSLPDRKLHQFLKVSREDFCISAIVNPHSRILNVYWDSIHRPVDAVLLMKEGEVSKWGLER